MKRIGVLLVNYRQWELSRRCVESLLGSRGVEVVPALVDNASPGPVPEWVCSTQGLVFHRSDANEGLTAGNNRAFGLLEGLAPDEVLILNNDTEVEPDAIALLSTYLGAHPEVGIAAPAILRADDPGVVWSAGGTLMPRLMRSRQEYALASDLPAEPVEVSFASGCAMLLRTGDFSRVGLQDPGLFVYCEDNDLCFRITGIGMRIHLVPASRVYHHGAASVGGELSPLAVYLTHRNRYIVAARYLGRTDLALFTAYYSLVTLIKTGLLPMRGRAGLVPWIWRAALHGMRGRAGVPPVELLDRGEG
ncbi:glycosyltransferase family 2 protein [Candidatus Fermentibacterales bacterium]|nr:glycosyltransferase family 2 protein [Candidatus Fermentibacterales bacterium]